MGGSEISNQENFLWLQKSVSSALIVLKARSGWFLFTVKTAQMAMNGSSLRRVIASNPVCQSRTNKSLATKCLHLVGLCNPRMALGQQWSSAAKENISTHAWLHAKALLAHDTVIPKKHTPMWSTQHPAFDTKCSDWTWCPAMHDCCKRSKHS